MNCVAPVEHCGVPVLGLHARSVWTLSNSEPVSAMSDFWNRPMKTIGHPPYLACQHCGGHLPSDSASVIYRDHMPYCSFKCATTHPGPPQLDSTQRTGV